MNDEGQAGKWGLELERQHELGEMPVGRMSCQAVMVPIDDPVRGVRRCVLVVGGTQRGDVPVPTVAVYDWQDGKWQTCARAVPPMSEPRAAMALCLGLGRVAEARIKTCKARRSHRLGQLVFQYSWLPSAENVGQQL